MGSGDDQDLVKLNGNPEVTGLPPRSLCLDFRWGKGPPGDYRVMIRPRSSRVRNAAVAFSMSSGLGGFIGLMGLRMK